VKAETLKDFLERCLVEYGVCCQENAGYYLQSVSYPRALDSIASTCFYKDVEVKPEDKERILRLHSQLQSPGHFTEE